MIQSNGQADNYFYAWSELGFRPVEWLRIGIAGQRSRIYNNERDIQRGPFGQVTWGPVTIGGYWFNPGIERPGVRRHDRCDVLSVAGPAAD